MSIRVHYTVPPKVAAVLESRSEEELTPVLVELKSSTDNVGAGIVQQWINIVRKHLHGTSGILTITSGSQVKDIQVVNYSYPVFDSSK